MLATIERTRDLKNVRQATPGELRVASSAPSGIYQPIQPLRVRLWNCNFDSSQSAPLAKWHLVSPDQWRTTGIGPRSDKGSPVKSTKVPAPNGRFLHWNAEPGIASRSAESRRWQPQRWGRDSLGLNAHDTGQTSSSADNIEFKMRDGRVDYMMKTS